MHSLTAATTLNLCPSHDPNPRSPAPRVRLSGAAMWTALCLASLLHTAGCESGFGPQSELDGYRVLGISADKPEVGPDDSVVLRAHDHDAAGASYTWRLCLFSLGAMSDFACATSMLELPMAATGATATVDFGPGGLGLRALYEQYGPFPNADGTPRTLKDGFDVQVSLLSGPAGGRQVRSVKSLHIAEGGATPNANPGIAAFDVVGEVVAGRDVALEVTLAEDALQTFTDPSNGQSRVEEPVFRWYTTAGELAPGVTVGAERTTTLSLPGQVLDVTVYVAVRDGRGGLSVASRKLSPVAAQP